MENIDANDNWTVFDDAALQKFFSWTDAAFDFAVPDSSIEDADASERRDFARALYNAFVLDEHNEHFEAAEHIKLLFSKEDVPPQMRYERARAADVVKANERNNPQTRREWRYHGCVSDARRFWRGADEFILPHEFLSNYIQAPYWLVALPARFIDLKIDIGTGAGRSGGVIEAPVTVEEMAEAQTSLEGLTLEDLFDMVDDAFCFAIPDETIEEPAARERRRIARLLYNAFAMEERNAFYKSASIVKAIFSGKPIADDLLPYQDLAYAALRANHPNLFPITVPEAQYRAMVAPAQLHWTRADDVILPSSFLLVFFPLPAWFAAMPARYVKLFIGLELDDPEALAAGAASPTAHLVADPALADSIDEADWDVTPARVIIPQDADEGVEVEVVDFTHANLLSSLDLVGWHIDRSDFVLEAAADGDPLKRTVKYLPGSANATATLNVSVNRQTKSVELIAGRIFVPSPITAYTRGNVLIPCLVLPSALLSEEDAELACESESPAVTVRIEKCEAGLAEKLRKAFSEAFPRIADADEAAGDYYVLNIRVAPGPAKTIPSQTKLSLSYGGYAFETVPVDIEHGFPPGRGDEDGGSAVPPVVPAGKQTAAPPADKPAGGLDDAKAQKAPAKAAAAPQRLDIPRQPSGQGIQQGAKAAPMPTPQKADKGPKGLLGGKLGGRDKHGADGKKAKPSMKPSLKPSLRPKKKKGDPLARGVKGAVKGVARGIGFAVMFNPITIGISLILIPILIVAGIIIFALAGSSGGGDSSVSVINEASAYTPTYQVDYAALGGEGTPSLAGSSSSKEEKQNDRVKALVELATKEVQNGIDDGTENYGGAKYIEGLGVSYDAWCSEFVGWCMTQTGWTRGKDMPDNPTYSAAYANFYGSHPDQGEVIPSCDASGNFYHPKAGDIMLVGSNMHHTCLVIEDGTDSGFKTAEGNYGNKTVFNTRSYSAGNYFVHLTPKDT